MRVDIQAIARVHFEPKKIDDIVFVNAGKLQTLLRQLPGVVSKATLTDIIQHFGLPHRVVEKKKSRAVVPDATISEGYSPRVHLIYVEYAEVLKLNMVVALLIGTYATDPLCADGDGDATLMFYKDRPCPILELDEHERFVDDGVVYNIEIRGERAPDKILFKAEDIAGMFGMERLSTVLVIDVGYIEHEHYVELRSDPTLQVRCKVGAILGNLAFTQTNICIMAYRNQVIWLSDPTQTKSRPPNLDTKRTSVPSSLRRACSKSSFLAKVATACECG